MQDFLSILGETAGVQATFNPRRARHPAWLLAVSNGRLVFTRLASLTVIVLLLLPPARAYFRT
ncbi:hypothetical protein [Nonomuraea sp. B19D2]|uniref:hypothetical protein n=1 Tax=Nonomuraea sp. B19D2 TaxID=3159561 RepID=UPI0032DA74F4